MATPFADLDAFVALPRVAGLVLSPDGSRLVTSVAALGEGGTRWVSALWEVDPAGGRAARRLTRSAPGESIPAFSPAGDLLFVSERPTPDDAPRRDGGDGTKEKAALWLLPADGGEARPIAIRSGGIGAVAVARGSGQVVLTSPTMPGAEDADGDERLRKARADAKVTALLHESYPIRYWDHDLGPDEPRLLTAAPPAESERADGDALALRDLTPEPGRALDEQRFAVTPDGARVVTGWRVTGPRGDSRCTLRVLDTGDGSARVLVDEAGVDAGHPAVSPDGNHVVYVHERHGTYDEPPRVTLRLAPLDGGEHRDLLPGGDLMPTEPHFTGDGSGVVFVADEHGHAPLFRVDLDSGTLTRLTASGAHSDPCPSPDGRWVYALSSSVGFPPTPVRVAATGADQEPVRLPAPGTDVSLPGRVEEVHATAADGTRLRAWVALPADASPGSPAPLMLWIHGGPLHSWNSWNWRWCPWVAVERGYAVLLPDPALSTGYGREFLRRGWGQWGSEPYTDLMTLTDQALRRDDLDAARTAVLGGSFGGYMANWVAGHTDRFRAIVTHASLWVLDQMFGTTDDASFWQKEFGDPDERPERYRESSPHRHASAIATPMLVVHGDRDHRVPVGEALRLWWDLHRHGVDAKFLYFPDENHWVLTPNHAKVWYETVLGFCDHHVLGKPWVRPSLL